MQFAADNLPAIWPAEELARPDQVAAQRFLALAYLYGAGFPLRDASYAVLAASTAKMVKDNSGHVY